MEKMHFRIGQFSDEQINYVIGGSPLKINQGQVKESVKPQKSWSKIKWLLENDVRYILRKLAKMTDILLWNIHLILQKQYCVRSMDGTFTFWRAKEGMFVFLLQLICWSYIQNLSK